MDEYVYDCQWNQVWERPCFYSWLKLYLNSFRENLPLQVFKNFKRRDRKNETGRLLETLWCSSHLCPLTPWCLSLFYFKREVSQGALVTQSVAFRSCLDLRVLGSSPTPYDIGLPAQQGVCFSLPLNCYPLLVLSLSVKQINKSSRTGKKKDSADTDITC